MEWEALMGLAAAVAADKVQLSVIRRGPRLTPADEADLLSRLPPVERRRVGSLHRWEDRQDSALGWRLLHSLASERGASVHRGASGRPAADSPVDVSLSHSGGWIAAAVAVGARIGVDVEVLRVVSPSLAARCLGSSELAWLEQAAPGLVREARFLRLWTAKEAYLKATGVGLSVDPRYVCLDHSGAEPQLVGTEAGRWHFSSVALAGGGCATVCVERVC